eukprot:2853283-Rhodomonas_salina.2
MAAPMSAFFCIVIRVDTCGLSWDASLNRQRNVFRISRGCRHFPVGTYPFVATSKPEMGNSVNFPAPHRTAYSALLRRTESPPICVDAQRGTTGLGSPRLLREERKRRAFSSTNTNSNRLYPRYMSSSGETQKLRPFKFLAFFTYPGTRGIDAKAECQALTP